MAIPCMIPATAKEGPFPSTSRFVHVSAAGIGAMPKVEHVH
jgi:hypothetical protein